jgi:hypothetical protein
MDKKKEAQSLNFAGQLPEPHRRYLDLEWLIALIDYHKRHHLSIEIKRNEGKHYPVIPSLTPK